MIDKNKFLEIFMFFFKNRLNEIEMEKNKAQNDFQDQVVKGLLFCNSFEVFVVFIKGSS